MPDVKLAQGVFPEGSKVVAVPRTGDHFAGGDPVASAKVDARDGIVFKDLEVGPYWLTDEDGSSAVAFSSEHKPEEPVYTAPQNESIDWSTVPAVGDTQITTGAKGTKVAGRLVHAVPESHDVPAPNANQASISGKVPQRSATPLGEATPVDPGEVQPKPRQDEVKEGTQQRSDTELGEAAPLSPAAGPVRQEDFDGPQRSATETGEATPLDSAEPRGTAINPSSSEQAAGVRSVPEEGKQGKVKDPSDSKVKSESKAAAKAEVEQAKESDE
ncbi:MAG: hypothetical protein ACXWNS_08235 [Isosphaeraceae bacterium]